MDLKEYRDRVSGCWHWRKKGLMWMQRCLVNTLTST